jgi:hypothetical protein
MTNAKNTKPNTFVAFCSFLTWRLEPNVLNINGCVLRLLDFFLLWFVSVLIDWESQRFEDKLLCDRVNDLFVKL